MITLNKATNYLHLNWMAEQIHEKGNKTLVDVVIASPFTNSSLVLPDVS